MLRERFLGVVTGLAMGVGVLACGGRTTMDKDWSGQGWEADGADEDEVAISGAGGQPQTGTSTSPAPGVAGSAHRPRGAGGTVRAETTRGSGGRILIVPTGSGGNRTPQSTSPRRYTGGHRNAGGTRDYAGGAGHPVSTAYGGMGGHVETGGHRWAGGAWPVGGAGGRAWPQGAGGRAGAPAAGGQGGIAVSLPYPVAIPGQALVDILPGLSATKSCYVCAEKNCPEAQECSFDTSCAQGISCVVGRCAVVSGGRAGISVPCLLGCAQANPDSVAFGVQASACVYDRCVSECTSE